MRQGEWSIELSRKLYGLEHSIRGDVIDVDEDGYLVIKLAGEAIRVNDLMEKYKLDIAYIRVLPLIKRAMELIYEAFHTLAQLHGFRGQFLPVFPMKVNPTPVVIDAIWRYGEKYGWGFNTGSLGELTLLAKYAREGKRTLIFDGVVSENVLKILKELKSNGWRVIIDVEGEHDLELLKEHEEFEIGLRVKPTVRSSSKWAHSAGYNGKFGLTINTLINLKEEYKWITERAVLLHMHAGSQIYSLADISSLFKEIRETYVGLRKAGFSNLRIIDPGGGLAYPYVDVKNNSPEMPEYTVLDYFNELFKSVKDLGEPLDIVFEGGRYLVSAHRIVVSKVVDVRPYSTQPLHGGTAEKEPCIEAAKSIGELVSCMKAMKRKIIKARSGNGDFLEKQEIIEDMITDIREDAISKVAEILEGDPQQVEELFRHPGLLKMATSPSKRFILNMSIFADIPDAVLVDQYFQPVPTNRLNERPHVLATIADLTCDSMGELKEFISFVNGDVQPDKWFTLVDQRLVMIPNRKLRLQGVPLHLPNKGESYYVAFLDTGAYQDPLTMKHNLIYGAPEIIIDIEGEKPVIKLIEKESYYL